MKVAVTGGAGYLGSVLIDRLLAHGWSVRPIDTDLFAACAFPVDAPLASVPVLRRDIRDIVPEDLDGCQAVIHLAGLSNDPLGDLDPELTMAINHRGAVHVARAAREAGVGRFLAASSCSVYGAAGEAVLDERSPTNPVTVYARAKLAMERDIALLCSDRFAPIFLRPATVYGLSPRLRFDLVVNNLVAWAAATGEVRLKSDGTAWRPVVAVRDVARAMIGCLSVPAAETRNRVFNLVSSGANYRVHEIAVRIAAALPGTRVTHAPDAGRDRRNYRVDGGRLAALLGADWHRADLADEIEGLHAAFRQAGVTVEGFEGPRYQRLAHLRMRLASGALGADLRPADAAPA